LEFTIYDCRFSKSALEAAGYTHVVNGGGLGDLQ